PPEADQAALADRLERWRYHWLAERPGRMTDIDQHLVEALDLAANQLAGRAARPPRRPRQAVLSEEATSACEHPDLSPSCAVLDDARRWLDPSIPLDELTDRAARTTWAHFGVDDADSRESLTRRRILLYAPIYLSSFCINECVYCGFRFDQSLKRKHLSTAEAIGEADILRQRGFRHLLLVAGDFPRLTRTEYFAEIISRLHATDICPAIEIAPRTTRSYAELFAAGLCGVTLYQETYNERLYRQYHPGGTKAAFDWRLEAPERAAEAGATRLGLGVLLGLAEPRDDVLAMIRHAVYLQRRFPDCRLAFSLPRIHRAPPDFHPPYAVDDETFVRLYCALRLTFPDANLVLSTREQPALRDRLTRICITQLSAGSCTAPGGYSQEETDGQFPVHDQRRVDQVVGWLQTQGFRTVWDFDELEGCQNKPK
ncbi:MAG: radical SAM protein, partial [Pirellulales bacterium]|nr:radical SAM protein [Pirellulales bacterium]